MSVGQQPRIRFADTIPYQKPDSLDDLHGPRTGTVRVSSHICTSPDPVFDVADPGQRWGLYSATVRDGMPYEQVELLDRDWLIEMWPDLNLPTRCRAEWEELFPELVARTG